MADEMSVSPSGIRGPAPCLFWPVPLYELYDHALGAFSIIWEIASASAREPTRVHGTIAVKRPPLDQV